MTGITFKKPRNSGFDEKESKRSNKGLKVNGPAAICQGSSETAFGYFAEGKE